MKKCPRCNIVYHLGSRLRCLYCDTRLITVQRVAEENRSPFNRTTLMQRFQTVEEPVINQLIKERRIEGYARMMYIIGSFFQTRSFHFMYRFSRNQMKIGRDFSRRLILPVNLSSLLMIPWMFWNLLDSLYFRMSYKNYCPKCNWKYHESSGHTAEDCEYNREYSRLIDDIISAKIAESEVDLKRQAFLQHQQGKRSAYYDLCMIQKESSSFWDIVCVWFSVALIMVVVIWLSFPLFQWGLSFVLK